MWPGPGSGHKIVDPCWTVSGWAVKSYNSIKTLFPCFCQLKTPNHVNSLLQLQLLSLTCTWKTKKCDFSNAYLGRGNKFRFHIDPTQSSKQEQSTSYFFEPVFHTSIKLCYNFLCKLFLARVISNSILKNSQDHYCYIISFPDIAHFLQLTVQINDHMKEFELFTPNGTHSYLIINLVYNQTINRTQLLLYR